MKERTSPCIAEDSYGKAPGHRRWPLVLCCFLSAALAALLTSLYYQRQFAGLNAISQAMGIVDRNYYFLDQDTDKNMVTGALRGLTASMGDDYAQYYTREEYQDFVSANSGSFVGMGVLVSDEGEGVFLVTEVYDNTPAQEAGILAGDVLLTANGHGVEGETLSSFLEYITHEEGDVNTVTVLRDGQELTFTMTMREVYSPYVTYRMQTDTIGYIYISGFHGQVVREVQEAVKSLRGQGMQMLVLDVRDDLGGSLADVCEVADIFLPKDALITTVKSRVNKEVVYRTKKDGLDMPIAMLVNEYSASASELLSGALKDNGAAKLFGTVTFGKGIVQTFYDINFGRDGTIKFTTDAYYTPSGVCIQGTGITPDVEVELPEDVVYYAIYDIPYEQDTQLQAAVAYLEALNAN
ncbi:MAG: S41 family peptidase [Clostridia bacterium]|nr:S41 family peptidase [Clostridia bacterium]